MRNKRFLSLGLALMLIFTMLTGCGTPAVEEKPAVDTPVVETPAPETPAPEPEAPVALDEKEVLLAAAQEYLSTLPEKFNAMSAKDALQLLEDNPGQVMLVDLKSKEDYDAGHIPGAVNIPFAELGKNLDRLPKNKQIILQCYSGQTSSEATSLTRILGLNTFNFQGGFNFGWKPLELGDDTLETTENPLPDASAPTLNEEEQIIWDAVAKFFNDGKSYIEKPEDVHDLITSNPGAVHVLDIRSAEDYAKGHIEGAEHIAFKEVGDNFDKLPNNKPIYVVCYTGQTAAQVLSMLRVAGYNAFSVSRGMTGWDAAELPVVQ
jgi:rhodanese-related sulfurtransferase